MTASRSRYALSLSMNSNVDRRLACPRTVDFRLPMSLDLCQALAQSPRAVAALAAFRSVTGFNVTLLPTDGRPSLNGSKTSASPLCDSCNSRNPCPPSRFTFHAPRTTSNQ